MSKQREALELALDAFDNVTGKGKRCNAAIAAIKKALAEPEPNLALPEPKPVVWIRHENEWVGLAPKERLPIETPRPDARKPLSDERIDQIIASNVTITDPHLLGAVYMAIREVEAAHGIGEE